ncbi:MAG: HD domain-containing protein [Ruminococcaceae bacterium]|nr:HD domain-containing protein [Oscillospiraceae bacterium]
MQLEKMKEMLKTMLNEKRYAHSVAVMETAVELAERFGADVEKARIAGLLHDCAKNLSVQEMMEKCEEYSIALDAVAKQQFGLIHAFVGAKMLSPVFGVADEEIFDAVFYHTVGKPDMPILTKIIYIADGIEPHRTFEGVEEIRTLAQQDLDRALVKQIDRTIRSVLTKGTLLHTNTVDTRNFYLHRLMEQV